MWTIWRERNSRTYEDLENHIGKILKSFTGSLFDWSHVQCRRLSWVPSFLFFISSIVIIYFSVFILYAHGVSINNTSYYLSKKKKKRKLRSISCCSAKHLDAGSNIQHPITIKSMDFWGWFRVYSVGECVGWVISVWDWKLWVDEARTQQIANKREKIETKKKNIYIQPSIAPKRSSITLLTFPNQLLETISKDQSTPHLKTIQQ